jgi:hypothetical protein
MILENWSVTSNANRYVAPEIMHYYLQGNVFGHPNFEDDTFVVTSRIVEINDKDTYKEVITKSGSVYELYKDNVNKEAEKEYPDYYERLKLEQLGE